MDNELLIQLIQKHNRLIIPSLGAFLKKDQAGVEVIVYTPFLKKNDGVLAEALSANFGITPDESEMMISEFVGQVNYLLEQNGNYDITGIGTLKRDANGSIVLINEPKVKPIAVPQPQIVQQPVVVPQPQIVQQPVVVPQPQIVQQPVVVPQPQIVQPPVVAPQPQIVQQPVVVPQPQIVQPPVVAPQPQPVRQPMQQRVQSPIARPQAPQPRFPAQGGVSAPQQGRQMPNPMTRPAGLPSQGNPQQNRPVNPNQPQQQQQRRPARRPSPKGGQPKIDIWLLIAIIAAVLVTALLIYGYLNTDPTIDLTPMMDEVTQDTIPTK